MKTNTRAKFSTPRRPNGRRMPLLPAPRHIRKPRAPWGFKTKLTEDQKQILFRWLAIDTLTYDAAALRVESEFGIKPTMNALVCFWYSWCSPRLLQKRS